jgi:hypothetical protein
VAREKEERCVAWSNAPDQFVELAQQRPSAKVLADDHLKADALERAADGSRIIHSLAQLLIDRRLT